ncbi:hypothetical protein POM88_048659 [Heracleum sosnowskyi]|uniref:Uncharacterized protein n=1 Tax=Heracleum sosnowskyi TaxID=360622 RepID=A0AAD8GVM4_9APIA|nr:hypothetical protein POM88_048659 [Heracleum sosnowskyi]
MTVAHQSFAFNTSKVKIGPMKSFGLMKELFGGYDKVGATAVNFKNWNRDFGGIIGNANIQILLNKFKVELMNYDVFGDVIYVDATFNTNKCCIMDGGFLSSLKPFVWGENLDAFEFEAGWKSVLEAYDLTYNHWFVEMYECHHLWIPSYFRDDPLLGILRTTFWLESANTFFSNYHQSYDTLTQFYLCFETVMSKQRHVNSELNHKSDVAFPSTDTELFLEKKAAELYTREMFYKFQK